LGRPGLALRNSVVPRKRYELRPRVSQWIGPGWRVTAIESECASRSSGRQFEAFAESDIPQTAAGCVASAARLICCVSARGCGVRRRSHDRATWAAAHRASARRTPQHRRGPAAPAGMSALDAQESEDAPALLIARGSRERLVVIESPSAALASRTRAVAISREIECKGG